MGLHDYVVHNTQSFTRPRRLQRPRRKRSRVHTYSRAARRCDRVSQTTAGCSTRSRCVEAQRRASTEANPLLPGRHRTETASDGGSLFFLLDERRTQQLVRKPPCRRSSAGAAPSRVPRHCELPSIDTWRGEGTVVIRVVGDATACVIAEHLVCPHCELQPPSPLSLHLTVSTAVDFNTRHFDI